MVSKKAENFNEALRKSIGYDEMRLMSTDSLARLVDAEVVNKCRLSLYGQQSAAIKRLTHKTEDYYDMEKARASKGDYRLDAREFALEDDLAVIYFNHYGHGFYGGEIVDDASQGWKCPKCGLKYKMSLKAMPYECSWCKHITPIGELARDGVLHH